MFYTVYYLHVFYCFTVHYVFTYKYINMYSSTIITTTGSSYATT